MIFVALALVACGNKQWQQGDPVNNGLDFLCSVGLCEDSLALNVTDFTFDNDGEQLPHCILDMETCQALGLDKVMHVDTVTSVMRVWGVKNYPQQGIALLLGQVSYSDTRSCWLATFGKEGLIDFMRLGECGGMNLSYWDDVDEHTRHVGIDSMRMVMPDAFGKPIAVSRWVSYNVQRDGVDTDSTLWFIHNEVPVTIGTDGNFSLGKVGTVYSSDTTQLTPYWRNKRLLEVLSWTPLSDKTFCNKVETTLQAASGTITDPTQLLGDFHVLVANRLYSDPQGFMKWCCEHPESQLTRGMLKVFGEVSPEWLSDQFDRIPDEGVRRQARSLLGL